jgi:hypothetical protein
MNSLRHGTIGRCSCGDIGERRARFYGEPVCAKCFPLRSGILQAPGGGLSVVGRLTPSQRLARRTWLNDSRREALWSAVQEAQIGVPNDTAQPAARQTRRARGE